MRKIGIVLLVVLAVGAIAFGIFVNRYFSQNAEPGGATYTLNMDEVRELAQSIDGPKPDAIRVEEVATFAWPEWVVLAGGGFESRPMAAYSYQLLTDNGFMIIDAALDDAQAATMPGTTFHQEAYDRMIAALNAAETIVFTHEHLDHLGGITTHPDLVSLLPALRITEEQLSNPERPSSPPIPNPLLQDYEPIAYETATAVAPGVVLIEAPGHTVGSQMVFVTMAEGNEILFAGDVAWMADGIREKRARPRFISSVLLPDGEDRQNVAAQLVALNQLMESEPDVTIVAGHDVRQMNALIADGVLAQEFVLDKDASSAD